MRGCPGRALTRVPHLTGCHFILESKIHTTNFEGSPAEGSNGSHAKSADRTAKISHTWNPRVLRQGRPALSLTPAKTQRRRENQQQPRGWGIPRRMTPPVLLGFSMRQEVLWGPWRWGTAGRGADRDPQVGHRLAAEPPNTHAPASPRAVHPATRTGRAPRAGFQSTHRHAAGAASAAQQLTPPSRGPSAWQTPGSNANGQTAA